VEMRFAWALSPHLPDVGGALTDVLRGATGSPDGWAWDTGPDGPAVAAWDDERRLHLLVTPTGLSLTSERPDSEALSAAADATLMGCAELLHVTEMAGVGSGGIWTLAAENFGEAEEALEHWVFSTHLRTTLEPLGGRPADLILTLRFDAPGNVTTFVKVEPGTDKYAATGPYFISDMDESEFPPACLIADIDRRQDQAFAPSEAVERASRQLEHVTAQGQKLLATVSAP
jgi:hypothetical protein